MNTPECFRRELSQEQASKVLRYCAESGHLYWLRDRRGGRKAGEIAGALRHDGYVVIGVNGIQYRAHRLAWLLATGAWPEMHIDHINGKRDDNRFCNLREADRSENAQNIKAAYSTNSAGLLGAFWHSGRKEWRSAIKRNGIRLSLGSFESAESAHAAYLAAKRAVHERGTL